MNPTVYIVFISLLLDLLAFTIILPLFPSLLEHYRTNDNTGLYTWLTNKIKYFQEAVGAPEKFNSVLFGGFLGSMFSFLQFIASPIVGAISDVIGRKSVMIMCMVSRASYYNYLHSTIFFLFKIGISSSYVLWALSNNLVLFIIARFLGGISKGNVSLSMAIIADVSSMNTRGIGMVMLIGKYFKL